MNLQTIEEFVRLIEAGTVELFEIESDGALLRLRHGARSGSVRSATDVSVSSEALSLESAAASSSATIKAPATGLYFREHPLHSGIRTIQLPLTIQEGDVVGYLQVGAVVSAVLAPLSGQLQEQLIADGCLVDFGTELLRMTSIMSRTVQTQTVARVTIS
jgi:biotin carboxyl carrier protein